MKLCKNCPKDKLIFSSYKNPEFLKSIDKNKLVVKDLRPSEMKMGCHPSNADLELILNQKIIPKGTKIYYWAAERKPLLKSNKISPAVEAYNCKGTRKNFGCTSVKKDGSIVFKIMAPQCYKEGSTVYPKHMHFLVKDVKNDSWDKDKIYTILAVPLTTESLSSRQLKYTNIYITPMQVKLNWKKGNFYMVYALGDKNKSLHDLQEYKQLKHIRIPWNKKSFSIPDNIKKSQPLVVYCAHEKCDAAKKLMMRLIEHGYVNLFYMPDGMLGFSKESKKIFEEE